MRYRIFLILFAALLFCTTANAKEDNEAFTLNRLGITDEKICDPVTCDMVESVIKGLTGNSVSPETAISSDVLKAMIKALDYDYKIDNKDNVEEYKELAEEIDGAEMYVFDREMYPAYANYAEDCERVDAIAAVFPIFFILVAALGLIQLGLTRKREVQQ